MDNYIGNIALRSWETMNLRTPQRKMQPLKYIKTKYNPLVYNVNVNGTKNIVDKVIETKAKLIYISSVHAIPKKK